MLLALSLLGLASAPLACSAEFDQAVDYVSSMVSGSVGPLPDDLDPHEANAFAFEGGTTGTSDDPGENINQSNFRDSGGGIDVPTGAKASPLFGAQPFTQQLPDQIDGEFILFIKVEQALVG